MYNENEGECETDKKVISEMTKELDMMFYYKR